MGYLCACMMPKEPAYVTCDIDRQQVSRGAWNRMGYASLKRLMHNVIPHDDMVYLVRVLGACFCTSAHAPVEQEVG